jgi:adenylate cyclase
MAMTGFLRNPETEDDWRQVLTGEWRPLLELRKRMRLLPSEPRCKLCAAPFGGLGGKLVPLVGFGRWEGNPSLCRACFTSIDSRGSGGAEVPVSLLFADIRGSTGIAERLKPAQYSRLLDRFYGLASKAVLAQDGLVDKFVGDEIVALFIPAIAGADHAGRAIQAARALMSEVGAPHAGPEGPIPLGAGVHSGEAFVGVVGQSKSAWDFTAVGDAVNTAARLAQAAAPGEILVSVDAATAAGLDETLARRSIEVRGRSEPIEVVSLAA